jgi:hypothetical protein
MIKYNTHENDKRGINTIVLPIICLSEFSIFSSRGKTGNIKDRVVTQTSLPKLMDHEFRKKWSEMLQFAGVLSRFWYCLFLAVNVVYDFGLWTGRFVYHWRKNRIFGLLVAPVNKAQRSLRKAYRMLVITSKQGWVGKASIFAMSWWISEFFVTLMRTFFKIKSYIFAYCLIK